MKKIEFHKPAIEQFKPLMNKDFLARTALTSAIVGGTLFTEAAQNIVMNEEAIHRLLSEYSPVALQMPKFYPELLAIFSQPATDFILYHLSDLLGPSAITLGMVYLLPITSAVRDEEFLEQQRHTFDIGAVGAAGVICTSYFLNEITTLDGDPIDAAIFFANLILATIFAILMYRKFYLKKPDQQS